VWNTGGRGANPTTSHRRGANVNTKPERVPAVNKHEWKRPIALLDKQIKKRGYFYLKVTPTRG